MRFVYFVFPVFILFYFDSVCLIYYHPPPTHPLPNALTRVLGVSERNVVRGAQRAVAQLVKGEERDAAACAYTSVCMEGEVCVGGLCV